MKSSFYLPILKSKEGEFLALSKLDFFTRNNICPLFDLTPIEFDNQSGKKPKTLEDHLFNFCHRKFSKRWGSTNCFIDTHLLNNSEVNGVSCLEYVYGQLGQGTLIPIVPIPVVRLKPSQLQLQSLISIISQYNIEELGLRINLEDISSNMQDKIDLIMKQLSFDVSNVHLIFDLCDSDFTYVEDFADAIVSILANFPHLQKWKSFSICGGAFPPTGQVEKGENYIIRNDWKLYKHIIAKLSPEPYNRPINFGDYGVVSPGYFQYDPVKMSRSANIRYTLNESWFVIKGSALKNSSDYEQYVTQAEKITSQAFFLGEGFSLGDKRLKDCCEGYDTAGSPTVWNWAGNCHHFTKVVYDLFSTPLVA
ncbi:beta family protein [Flavobacterium sp.]|uniref:beta family protein n=1 Tax=Flavobacterium sp. TaxID=239 RepID=UPI0039E6187D